METDLILRKYFVCIVLISSLLVGCSASKSTERSNSTNESTSTLRDILIELSPMCNFQYMTPNHPFFPDVYSTKADEYLKYSWVKDSDYFDTYEDIQLNPEMRDSVLEERQNQYLRAKSCIGRVEEITEKLSYSDNEMSLKLSKLFENVKSNRERYLIPAQIVSELPLNKSSRKIFFENTNEKYLLDDEITRLLYDLRGIMDIDSGKFKNGGEFTIFIEKCPISTDMYQPGKILVMNKSSNSHSFAFDVNYKSENGAIIGSDSIYTEIPKNASRIFNLGGGNLAERFSGILFPPRCEITNLELN